MCATSDFPDNRKDTTVTEPICAVTKVLLMVNKAMAANAISPNEGLSPEAGMDVLQNVKRLHASTLKSA